MRRRRSRWFSPWRLLTSSSILLPKILCWLGNWKAVESILGVKKICRASRARNWSWNYEHLSLRTCRHGCHGRRCNRACYLCYSLLSHYCLNIVMIEMTHAAATLPRVLCKSANWSANWKAAESILGVKNKDYWRSTFWTMFWVCCAMQLGSWCLERKTLPQRKVKI